MIHTVGPHKYSHATGRFLWNPKASAVNAVDTPRVPPIATAATKRTREWDALCPASTAALAFDDSEGLGDICEDLFIVV